MAAKFFDLRMQSIRGLAALVVAFHHCIGFIPMHGLYAKFQRAVDTAISGQTAVLTFFVLSGYVLGLSMANTRLHGPSGYLSYSIKRFCRILIPLAIVVALSACIVSSILMIASGKSFVQSGQLTTNTYFCDSYNRPFQFVVLLQNILLVAHDLDPVTWTITIEIIGSMLIPFFFFINRGQFSRWALLAALVVGCVLIPHTQTSYLNYLYMFELGLLIPNIGKVIVPALKSVNLLNITLVCMLLLCLINGHMGHNYYMLSSALTFILCYVIYSGAKWLRVLDQQAIEWLGMVSYSFYLLHWPVVWIFAWTLYSRAPLFTASHPVLMTLALLLASVPVAALLAHLSYLYVEVPAMSFARYMISHFKVTHSEPIAGRSS